MLHYLRMQAIMERVRKHEALPLLSLPTNEFGWIDSVELSRRLAIGVSELDPWDQCLAILRLAVPDAALIDKVVGNSKHHAVLFAKDWLLKANQNKEQSFDWQVMRRVSPEKYTFTSIGVKPDPLTIPAGFVLEPGVKIPKEWEWGRPPGAEVLMEGFLTPNFRETYFASGVEWLGHTLQSTEVADKDARFYLHFLQDPQTKPGRMAGLLLALAVTTGDRDVAVAGIDMLIMLIAQQRLDLATLARSMKTLFHEGCVKANRWAQNLGAVAKASGVHSQLVYRLLQDILSTPLAMPPKDIHFLLALLVELQSENGEPLSPDTLACLQAIELGGKTRKLIDSLR
jgi:hypothetical protein